MELNTGLNKNQREKVSKVLNKLLANEFVLYTKTRNYHWNVVGPNFTTLHKFFEENYQTIEGFIDDSAERVRMLGQTPLGSMKEFLETTTLKENTKQLKSQDMIKDLLNDHETIIRELREGIEEAENNSDSSNADFMTGVMEEHEKIAWMLRSMLE